METWPDVAVWFPFCGLKCDSNFDIFRTIYVTALHLIESVPQFNYNSGSLGYGEMNANVYRP